MIYLVDTNVLLRFADRSHSLHPVVRNAVRKLRHDGHQLQVAAQHCVEFWNVATRPAARNGLGLTPVDADRLLKLIERLFPLFPMRLLFILNGVDLSLHTASLASRFMTLVLLPP